MRTGPTSVCTVFALCPLPTLAHHPFVSSTPAGVQVRVQLPIEGRFEDSAGNPSEQTTRTDQGHPTSGGPLHQLLRELPLSRCRLRKWSYDLLSAIMCYFPDKSTSYPTDRNPGQTRNLRSPDSPAIACSGVVVPLARS